MTYPRCRSSFAPLAWLLAAGLVVGLGGCRTGPVVVPEGQRRAIDRRLVEYPSGVELVEVVRNLTGPVDVEVDPDGNLIVAESGRGGYEPRIFGMLAEAKLANGDRAQAGELLAEARARVDGGRGWRLGAFDVALAWLHLVTSEPVVDRTAIAPALESVDAVAAELGSDPYRRIAARERARLGA